MRQSIIQTEPWQRFARAIKEGYGENISARDVVPILEAIVTFNNDPDVGGPDDPLDHEDFADLELLGLWNADDNDNKRRPV